MNTFALRLARWFAQTLDAQDRDALIGDHAELGVPGLSALRDVLGLVIRRQLQIWSSDWRPWLTLLAAVIPLGVLLSLASQRIASSSSVPLFIYVSNWTPIFLESPGSRSDMLKYALSITNQYVILACWSWSVGFVLGLLSRSTTAVSGVLFSLSIWTVCFLQWGLRGGYLGASYPYLLLGLLVSLPSVWGMRQGSGSASGPQLARNVSWLLAFVTVAVMVARNWGWILCLGGAYRACSEWAAQAGYTTLFGVPPVRQLPALPLALIGPVGYLLVTLAGRRWSIQRGDAIQ